VLRVNSSVTAGGGGQDLVGVEGKEKAGAKARVKCVACSEGYWGGTLCPPVLLPCLLTGRQIIPSAMPVIHHGQEAMIPMNNFKTIRPFRSARLCLSFLVLQLYLLGTPKKWGFQRACETF
jgi:hypothetical protein